MFRVISIIMFLYSMGLSEAQIVPTGTGGSGPGQSNVPFEITMMTDRYNTKIKELLGAFKESWKKCNQGKPPFEDLRGLNAVLIMDRLSQMNHPNTKSYCKSSCLFSKRAKNAIAAFNASKYMQKFLVQEKKYSEQEADVIVKTFKSYD